MKSLELKVKLKHLAAESRIIRAEACKVHGADRYRLNHHRTWDVRNEARATHLAYQYLRGIAYHRIERTCDVDFRKRHIDKRVRRMVEKYGPADLAQGLDAWFVGAVAAAA